MASKIDKLLESAQKSIAKGQIGRAIGEYEQIVALDPNDIRHRQRLAELLAKASNKEAAIAQYEAISKQFADKHFYLKAIAVHKQIQKLDPDNIKITLTLASLNEKQGLVGNALAEYNLAVTHYLKEGKVTEAIDVIERMLAADPDNLNTRLKCAETYFVAGFHDKAFEEFTRLALLLRKRGDESAFCRVCERVQSLFPDKHDFILDILATQIEEGDPAGAATYLRKFVDDDKADLRGWKLLADAYLGCGDGANRKLTLQKIIDRYPAELFAQESMIRLHLDEGDIDGAQDRLKAYEANFIGQGAVETLERVYASLREKASGDPRALNGLKSFSGAAGDTEKPATIVAATDTFAAKTETTPPSAAVADLPVAPEPKPVAPVSKPVEPVPKPQEMSWEEEIDLSLLEEEGIGAFQGVGGEGGVTESMPEFTGEEDADAYSLAGTGLESGAEGVAGQTGHGLPETSVGLTEIEMEIDGPAITFEGWQQGVPEIIVEEGGPPPVEPAEPAPAAVESPEVPSPPAEKRKKYDAAGDFSEFKKVVDNQLAKDDTETHYNLGIAYKEMCLFDDAINEFQTASMDPQRKVDCLTLQAMCYRDKGDNAKAEEVFTATLALRGLNAEERVSLTYELAFLYEIIGRAVDALRFYRQVRAEDPGFRDAAEKIALLGGGDKSADQEDSEPFDLDAEELE